MANILANATNFRDVRHYVVDNKIFSKIIEMLKGNQINEHRRLHLTESMRNISFEYEKYGVLFAKAGLVSDIAQILVDVQGIELEEKDCKITSKVGMKSKA